MLKSSKEDVETETIHFTSLDQLNLDWNQPFINQVYAVDEDQSCKNDDEPVLASVWFGSQPMCVNNGYLKTKGGTCK